MKRNKQKKQFHKQLLKNYKVYQKNSRFKLNILLIDKKDAAFNAAFHKERLADIKGKVARDRREAQLKKERKAAERRVCTLNHISQWRLYIIKAMLAACETEEERQALLDQWEAERLAEEAEIERLKHLAAEQRKIQLDLLKGCCVILKYLQMWTMFYTH